jgi:hypothetical protein
MPRFKRRHFLQLAGSTLATLGISQFDLMQQNDRYARVLAQTTPRKLALLVGINQYPDVPLRGCVTDTNLQQQLLIHRFGFNPKDILILTDEKATRQNILTAFEEHLIKQAKPGDVVVFHFSGHGTQVHDPDCDASDCLTTAFVPFESSLWSKSSEQGEAVPGIMGRTLFLLMHALQTENVTAVLDTCYSGGGTRGNLRIRSVVNPASLTRGTPQTSAKNAEHDYQQQWLSRLNLSPEEFKQKRRQGVAKGVVIASTKRNQEAADDGFNGFFAGIFTYLMTQYLWQQLGSESFSSAIPNVARTTTRKSFTNQEPIFEIKPGTDNGQQPLYFLKKQTPPAEAVITQIEGNRAQLWLGGIDPDSLEAFQAGAILSAVDSQGRQSGRVQIETRNGLRGEAKLLDAVQPGAFLQERSRAIPPNLTLKIGLDPSLGGDASTVKQALSALKRVETFSLPAQEVHYILGRMTPTYRQQVQPPPGATLPEVGSLGLFSPALELVPNSFGASGETATGAIQRLHSKFNSLLAARIVKTVINTNSSRLNVVASMHLESGAQTLAKSIPLRGSNQPQPTLSSTSRKLPQNTPIQFQVTNNETSNLYVSVLTIDPTGDISVLFPNQWSASEEITLVKAGQTLSIPDSKDNFRLVTQPPIGVGEVLILASKTPLREALTTLRDVAAQQLGTQGNGPVILRSSAQQNDAGQVVDDLLNDISSSTRGGANSATPNSSNNPRSIETNQLAALSITYEVF